MAIAKSPCPKNPEPHTIGESGSPKIVQKSGSRKCAAVKCRASPRFPQAGLWPTSGRENCDLSPGAHPMRCTSCVYPRP